MSVIKSVMQPTGVSAGYWQVDSAVMDMSHGNIAVTYSGWLDQDSFNAGKQKLLTKNVNITLNPGDTLTQQVIAFLDSIVSSDLG